MSPINPLYDASTDNAVIPTDIQHQLNQPLKGDGFSAEDQAFLDLILQKIADKSINLYSPSSLLNTSHYEQLSPEAQAKADQNAVILLTKIREIYNLVQVNPEPSYQLQNMVDSLHYTKKRLENEGDIFII